MSDLGKACAVTFVGVLTLATGPVARAEGSHRCASVADDQDRLACYDAAFGKTAAPTGATAATSAAVAGSKEGATRAHEEFGLSETAKRARQPEQSAAPESITGQVSKIGYRPTGEMVVTLADGQVWTQIESDNRSRVKVGDGVTIRKATLGSYLLLGPDRIAVRVRRLK